MNEQDKGKSIEIILAYHLKNVAATFGKKVKGKDPEYIAKLHEELDGPCPICKSIYDLYHDRCKAVKAERDRCILVATLEYVSSEETDGYLGESDESYNRGVRDVINAIKDEARNG